MVVLEDFNLTQLKKLASNYNKQLKILRYSQLTKQGLINLMRNHPAITLKEGGSTLKIKVNKEYEEQLPEKKQRKPRTKKPKPPTPKPRKPKPKPEPEPKPEPKPEPEPPTPRPRVPKPLPQVPKPEPKKKPKKPIKKKFDINQFLDTKPTIKELLEYLAKFQLIYFKNQRSNFDGKISPAFIIGWIADNEIKETILKYISNNGEKQFCDKYITKSDGGKEVMEKELYDKYVLGKKPPDTDTYTDTDTDTDEDEDEPEPLPQVPKEPEQTKKINDFIAIFTLEIQKTKDMKELGKVLHNIFMNYKPLGLTLGEFMKLEKIGEEHRKTLKEAPPPQKRKVKKNPNTKISIQEALKIYEKDSINHPVPFVCMEGITDIMFLDVIMSKHYNDCVLMINTSITQGKKKQFLMPMMISANKGGNFKVISDPYGGFDYKEISKKISNKYLECKKNKKALVIPLQVPGHQNMIIFNYERKEMERFEPHGDRSKHLSHKVNDKINSNLEKLVKSINRNFLNLNSNEKISYVPPYEICPIGFRGFQNYENDDKQTHNFSVEDFGKYEVIVNKDFGYCCAWSFFYLDLRLTDLSKSGNEIYTETSKEVSKKPIRLKNFIRGLTNTFYKKLIERLKKIQDKRKFSKLDMARFIEDKISEKRGRSGKQSGNILYALGLLNREEFLESIME
tara:strand:- start:3377 stop:5410 length:2034 start_codon:yes stop_codon:yes gene_type:complete